MKMMVMRTKLPLYAGWRRTMKRSRFGEVGGKEEVEKVEQWVEVEGENKKWV